MKKCLLAAMAAALILPVASCNKESVDERTSTLTVSAYNLYTGLDDNTVDTKLANYTFTVKYPDNTIMITTEGMLTPDGSTSSFSTIEMPLKQTAVELDGKYAEVINFSAKDATAKGANVTDLSGELNQGAYGPGAVVVPGYEKWLLPSGFGHLLLAEYKLEDKWLVRTFWPDMTWRGSTQTTYPGMEEPYVTQGISYRVVMQRDAKNNLTGKADVVFYNAKFAPKAPELTVVLPNVDLTFSKSGYKISGTEVTPSIFMDGQLLPNQRFVFNSFDFECYQDMLTTLCTYEVAGMYKGRFTGMPVAGTNLPQVVF